MTENAVDGGRLFVEVVSDATGFRRDLKAKLDAAVRNLRATVQVELDARGLSAKARQAAQDASRQAKINVRAEVDARQLRTSLTRAVREARDAARLKAAVTFDESVIRRDLRQSLNAAASAVRPPRVNVEVGADAARMHTEIDAARRSQETRPIRLRATVDTSGLHRALKAAGSLLVTLSKFPVIASGLLVAAGAAVNLAGALFSVSAAGSQAVGVLAAIPGLIAVAAQGLTALVVGFVGIGDAVTALTKAQQAGTAASGQSASAQTAHLEQIKAARQRLADAQRDAAKQVADAERQSARQIADAEESLRRSQADSRRAQQELNQARKEAVEELQQLAFQTRDAALSEEQASISLERAKAKVLAARQSAVMSPLDRRQSELDYKQAILNLAEAKDRASDLAKENQRAQRAGVEGTDTYRSAERQLAEAKQATSEAERGLAEARRSGAQAVAEARTSGARQVADAQRALQTALRATTGASGGTSAAMTALGLAMDNLSPAGQRFARFIHGTLMPRFKTLRFAVQEALLPPLQRGITKALPLLGTLQPQLARTGAIIGNLAEKAGELAGSPAFRRDTTTIMRANNVALQHFGQAGLHLADALRHVMVAASPLVIRIAKLAELWAKNASESAKSGRESKRLADFFDRAWETAGKLFRIVRDVTVAIFNLGKAARPSGDTLLDSLARGAAELRRWTADPKNQTRIQAFFDNTVPVAEQFADILGRVVGLLIRFGEASGGGAFDGLFFVLDKFLDVLEAIARIPGGGTILTTIFLLSGAGLGLGLVAKAVGGIAKNLGTLSKFTGLTALFGAMTGRGRGGGRGGTTSVGQLADDLNATTTAIDRELPQDRKKTDALNQVAGSAERTGKATKGAATGIDGLGKSAERGAARSGRFGRVLGGVGRAAGRVLGPIGRLAGQLLRIPGVGTALSRLGGLISRVFSRIRVPRLNFADMFRGASRVVIRAVGGISQAIRRAFSRIKLPSLNLGRIFGGLGRGGAAGASGALGRIFGGLRQLLLSQGRNLARAAGSMWSAFTRALTRIRLPSAGSILSSVGRFISRMVSGLGRLIGRLIGGFVKNLPRLLGKAAKGAFKGGRILTGPWGLVGGIIAMVLGDMIGGKAGGAIGGAATGAGIGAFLGPVGAIVGAIIGAIVGAFGREIKGLPGKIIRGVLALGGGGGRLGGRLAVFIAGWLGRGLGKLAPIVGKALWAAARAIPGLISRSLGWAFRTGFGTLGRLAARLWNGMWGAVSRATGVALRGIGGFVARNTRSISAHFTTLRRDVVARVTDMFNRMVSTARTAPRTALAWVTRHLTSIRARFQSARAYVAGRVALMFQSVINSARNLLRTAATWVTRHLTNIRARFNNARTYVTGRFKSMVSDVAAKAKSYMTTVRTTISNALNRVESAFRSAVSAVGRIWDGLRAKTRAPVSFLVNTVYMGGVRRVFELVRKLVPALPSLPSMHFAKGGTVGNVARGYGVLPGYAPGKDRMWAAVSPGEAWLRPEVASWLGPKVIDLWNKMAIQGRLRGAQTALTQAIQPAFRDGGIVGRIKSILTNPATVVKDIAGAITSKGASWVAHNIIDPILGRVGSVISGDGLWNQAIRAMPNRMAAGFFDFIKNVVEPNLGGGVQGVVNAAKKYIGQGDDRGDNDNRFSRQWGMPGAPWCAMFVSTAIKDAKATNRYPGYPSAAVAAYNGAMRHVGVGSGKPGDLAVYRGSGHINIIEKKAPGGYMTIGGNQNRYVQRAVRGGQSSVLRPRFAQGGRVRDMARYASQIFHREAPYSADPHELDTPLVKFMRRLPPSAVRRVAEALAKTGMTVTDRALVRDSGGPVPPGSYAYNGRRRAEWMLSPEAIDLLGGERAVAALNAGANRLYRSSRTLAAVRTGGPGRPDIQPVINVYPQKGQSEHEIAVGVSRKMGALLR